MTSLSTARFIDYDASKYNYFQESICKTDQCVATAINQHVWSPCIWTDGKRKKKNFLYSDLVAFDFDSGVWTLDDCIDFVSNIAATWAIIGTTKSHQRDKNGITCDRFRLVMRWATRIHDRNQYEQNVSRITRALPADKSTVDAGRLFYPCVNIVYSQTGLAVKALPYTEPVRQGAAKTYFNRDNVPPWMVRELDDGVTANRHSTAFRFALHLKDRGLDEYRAFDILSNISIGESELKRTIRNAFKHNLITGGNA